MKFKIFENFFFNKHQKGDVMKKVFKKKRQNKVEKFELKIIS